MKLSRVKFSNDATIKLRTMKIRTGLTPNILCRLGFMLSLKDPSIPLSESFPEDGMEINRYTLTGDYDLLFCSFLKQRCYNDGLSTETDMSEQFRAHMNRGVFILAPRIKDLDSIAELVESVHGFESAGAL